MYIENLLTKYPATTDQEEREILIFITKGSALDAALLTCNDTIAEKLKMFKHDHRKQLGLTLRNWINFVGLLSSVGLAAYFLVEFAI